MNSTLSLKKVNYGNINQIIKSKLIYLRINRKKTKFPQILFLLTSLIDKIGSDTQRTASLQQFQLEVE